MKRIKTSPASAPALKDANLRRFMGYNMKRAYLTIDAGLRPVLEGLGLRPATFSALAVIVDNPDITQTMLGQALHIERSGVVLIVDDLEAADLISRNKVEGDRRSYALRLTLKGRKLWARARQMVEDHDNLILAGLSPQERTLLKDLLNRIETAPLAEPGETT
ncbi:DNA-binding MarR family transcriptional regulator [Rhodobacter sp. JA431]|uniref:MarR family winged helix-turn-helix transcriptional regulator n=1 Tax=Rhodobacter sp. JA431 TaxID=570013 RepID=UPI000BC71E90|nr:MarR family winged helix-turn-helix transcriptional regulator [Rhodobacter sp. JA431]SOC00031.1 DNA-binding MarR family transcriptional regulator [Rhodobacter sp. JA431]